MSHRRPYHTQTHTSSFSSSKSKQMKTTSGKNKSDAMESQRISAEFLTYFYEDEMVYVKPALNYEAAVDYARSVFPQLNGVDRSRIVFSVNVRVRGGQSSCPGEESLKKVRIAPMAWLRVIKSLSTYEVLQLSLLPEVPHPQGSSGSSLPSESKAIDDTTREEVESGVMGDAPPLYQDEQSEKYADSDKSARYTFIPHQEMRSCRGGGCVQGGVADCICKDRIAWNEKDGDDGSEGGVARRERRSGWSSLFTRHPKSS